MAAWRQRQLSRKDSGLAAANGDFINAMNQATEFNLMGGHQRVVGLAVYITDLLSLPPNTNPPKH